MQVFLLLLRRGEKEDTVADAYWRAKPAILKPVSVTRSRENSGAFTHPLAHCNQKDVSVNSGSQETCWLGSSTDSGLCRLW